MATAPLFLLSDGSGKTAQTITFTTNQDMVALAGIIDGKTVDVQVSINGSTFVSDPTLVYLDYLTFVVPNPNSYPNGLALTPGANSIQVRAIDMSGGISAPAVASIMQIPNVTSAIGYIPTGIEVQRNQDYVALRVAAPSVVDPTSIAYDANAPVWQGFNIYAGSMAAGAAGYYRVNNTVLQAQTTWEQEATEVYTDSTTWANTPYNVRIRVTVEDQFGQEIAERLNTVHDIKQYAGQIQFSSSVNSILQTQYVEFDHYRNGMLSQNTVNSDQFADVSDSSPLYYVVTAIYWDPTNQVQFETPYSQEVLGTPLVLDTTVKNMPQRTQRDVTIDFISAIQRADANVACIPGSTTRDVSCDPFASEAERIWFIVNFVHACGSFLTLLQLDDANGDGISDDVASSAYKQALKAAMGFTSDSSVQALFQNLPV